MSVLVNGYTVDALFGSSALVDKPKATFPYHGGALLNMPAKGRKEHESPVGARAALVVEMALVALLLFILIEGIMDVSVFLFCGRALVERARAAARWGVRRALRYNRDHRCRAIFSIDGTCERTALFGLTAPAMVAVSAPDADTDNSRLVVVISGYSFQFLSPFLSGRYGGTPITVSIPLDQYNRLPDVRPVCASQAGGSNARDGAFNTPWNQCKINSLSCDTI